MASIKVQRASAFSDIYGVKTFSEVLGLFEKDYNSCKNKSTVKINTLFGKYAYAIFFMYSPSSIRNNLVAFKNVIKANGGRFEAIAQSCFKIDEVYAPLKVADKAKKEELKANLEQSENEANPEKVITAISSLKDTLDNKDYDVAKNQKESMVRAYHLLALLGLVTGRRFAELVKTFTPSKNRAGIKFDGLLKGNSEAIEGHIIGLEYKEMTKYLKELRSIVNATDLSVSEINAKYAKVFNLALKRLGYENVKSLRTNYSVAGSQLFKRDNEDMKDTITRILGHKEHLASSLNYTNLPS